MTPFYNLSNNEVLICISDKHNYPPLAIISWLIAILRKQGFSATQRRILHTAIGTTPYNAWFNKVLDDIEMCIFGSHVYVVDTDVTRQKLDPRTFLGYYLKVASTTRVIVFYNPATRKIGRSTHVYFDGLNVAFNLDGVLQGKHQPLLIVQL